MNPQAAFSLVDLRAHRPEASDSQDEMTRGGVQMQIRHDPRGYACSVHLRMGNPRIRMKTSSLMHPPCAMASSDPGSIRMLSLSQALAFLHGRKCIAACRGSPDRRAAPARSTSFQFHASALLGREIGRGPAVIGIVGQQMPRQHCQLAGHRDDGYLRPATCTHALVERAERPRKANGSVSGLHQQPTGMRLALPANVARISGPAPRLSNPWIQTQVADEMCGTRETRDVTDHSNQRSRGNQAHAWDSHQAQHALVPKGRLGHTCFGRPDLSFHRVQQSERTVDLKPFIDRQGDVYKPTAARLAEQVAERMPNEVTLQDSMHPIPQASPLLHQRLVMRQLPAAMPVSPRPGPRRVG